MTKRINGVSGIQNGTAPPLLSILFGTVCSSTYSVFMLGESFDTGWHCYILLHCTVLYSHSGRTSSHSVTHQRRPLETTRGSAFAMSLAHPGNKRLTLTLTPTAEPIKDGNNVYPSLLFLILCLHHEQRICRNFSSGLVGTFITDLVVCHLREEKAIVVF